MNHLYFSKVSVAVNYLYINSLQGGHHFHYSACWSDQHSTQGGRISLIFLCKSSGQEEVRYTCTTVREGQTLRRTGSCIWQQKGSLLLKLKCFNRSSMVPQHRVTPCIFGLSRILDVTLILENCYELSIWELFLCIERCLQELCLTAELDHVKGQHSFKNECFKMHFSWHLLAFFFLSVPFHYVRLLAHSKIHLLWRTGAHA